MTNEVERAEIFFKVKNISNNKCEVTFFKYEGKLKEIVTLDTFHPAAGAFIMGLLHGDSKTINVQDLDDLPF